MKIIETKDWSKSWSLAFTCSQCESKLEASVEDLQCVKPSGGNPHDYDPGYFYVECSVCKQRLRIDEETIPKYVRTTVSNKTHNYDPFDR